MDFESQNFNFGKGHEPSWLSGKDLWQSLWKLIKIKLSAENQLTI